MAGPVWFGWNPGEGVATVIPDCIRVTRSTIGSLSHLLGARLVERAGERVRRSLYTGASSSWIGARPLLPSPALRAPRSAPRLDRFAIRRSSAQEAVLPKRASSPHKWERVVRRLVRGRFPSPALRAPSPASGRGLAEGRYATAFSPPTLGRCGTCASSRRLPATRPGARSSVRREIPAPGAAS